MKSLPLVTRTYKIFQDWFGEEHVDLQASKDADSSTYNIKGYTLYIIVWFPEVRITNEYDASLDLKNLYVKIPITNTGQLIGGITLNKSFYTYDQWVSRYVHSHTPRISHESPQVWSSPCLGDGPIRSTMNSLGVEYSEEIWKLFCLELSQYVETESLSGGPYVRLESVSANDYVMNFELMYWHYNQKDRYSNNIVHQNNYRIFQLFVSDLLLNNTIPFAWSGYTYKIAMSLPQWFIYISNKFIEFINKNPELIKIYNRTPDEQKDYIAKLFTEVVIKDGKFYTQEGHSISDSPKTIKEINKSKKVLFNFKDKPVTLYIELTEIDNKNIIHVLKEHIALYLYHLITFSANINYAKSKIKRIKNDQSTNTDKVFYLSI